MGCMVRSMECMIGSLGKDLGHVVRNSVRRQVNGTVELVKSFLSKNTTMASALMHIMGSRTIPSTISMTTSMETSARTLQRDYGER
jgi:hypothetical protein